jgi:hypothetical protein
MDLQTLLLLVNLIATVFGLGRVAVGLERRLTKLETTQEAHGAAITRLQERSS